MPLEKQLRELLEYEAIDQLLGHSQTDGSIHDITDGSQYKSMGASFPNFISLTCNTDGVPVFSSSKVSLWPVYYVVNEMPLANRRKCIILHALWSGIGKPRIECLFQPVVSELKHLFDVGFKWMRGNVECITKVCLGLVCCDSVARPLLQRFKQFNGRFGCSFCLAPGVSMAKGRGNVRVYPIDILINDRCHEQTLEHAVLADQTKSDVFGVKGTSVLSLVPKFDIINGFNPEYMHVVLLGVVRQFANLWLDCSSNGKPYYLGKNCKCLDDLIVRSKPPSEIKRLPRSISNTRRFWKASEWRSFLLFYSPVYLMNLMPRPFYNHWLLLSFSVYTLLQSKITRENILYAEIALHKFVSQVGSLYGKQFVSYNVHLLTHLAQSVKLWGPLWATSAFLFEDANGKLLRSFHGTKGITKQIFSHFLSSRSLEKLGAQHVASENDMVAECYNE
jgi:hypothetical protein